MNRILALLIFILFLGGCKLTSQTNIAPNKSFVLGQGEHGSYSATVKNIGADGIEVLLTKNDTQTSLGILNPGEKSNYQVSKNCMVVFKNLSADKFATINIKAKGDTNLSMGYQDNK